MNIKELRKEFNLTQEALSVQTGIPKGRINGWEQQGSKPKMEDYSTLTSFFERLKEQKFSNAPANKFEESLLVNQKHIPLNKKAIPFDNFSSYINAEEIGEMRKFEESEIEYISGNQFIDIGNGYMQMQTPWVQEYAYAGYLTGYSDPEFLEELPKFPIIVSKYHRGDYRSFTVRGDSMDDNSKHSISNGEVAIGRKIHKNHWINKLHIYQWHNYAIVHESGIIIKRITNHDVENGIITCVSLNPDKSNYPDLTINLSECYELYNIVQVVRNNF